MRKKYDMKRLILQNKEGVVSQIHRYLGDNPEAKFIHRLQVLLLFAGKEDESCDSLGALFGNSPRSVSNWIKRVNQTGEIESLRGAPSPGRPSRLTKEQKEEIRKALQDIPGKYGMSDKQWNGRNLSLYISRQYGIVLKIRSCQRLFHELSAIK